METPPTLVLKYQFNSLLPKISIKSKGGLFLRTPPYVGIKISIHHLAKISMKIGENINLPGNPLFSYYYI